MQIDNYYVTGLIYVYMRERIKMPAIDISNKVARHRSFCRSACYTMLEIIKNESLLYSVSGVETLFEFWISKFDDYACRAKSLGMSYYFSTCRDVWIDLESYILGNLAGDFPRALAIRRHNKRKERKEWLM